MRNYAIALMAGLAVLGACSAEETAPAATAHAVELDAGMVLAITAEFAVHKGMNELCDGNGPDHLEPFLQELTEFEAPPDLVDNANRVAEELLTMIRDEEPEYVCTPEMFESASARVAEAGQDWIDMKSGAND